MSVSLGRRVSCSLEALSIAWLISGVVFAVVVKGPGTISAWLIWGTFFFLSGWMLVGLLMRVSQVSTRMRGGGPV